MSSSVPSPGVGPNHVVYVSDWSGAEESSESRHGGMSGHHQVIDNRVLSILEMCEGRITDLEMKNQWRDDQYLVMRHAVADISKRLEKLSTHPSHLSSISLSEKARQWHFNNRGERASSTFDNEEEQLSVSSRKSSTVLNTRKRSSHTTSVPSPGHVSGESIEKNSLKEMRVKKIAVPMKSKKTQTTKKHAETDVDTEDEDSHPIWPKFVQGGVLPRNAPQSETSEPNAQLIPQWIYGYRTCDTRPNLYYTHAMHLVFFVGKIAVVYNGNNMQRFFTRHTDTIQAMTVDSTGHLAASSQSGQTPQIIIWDVDTLEPRCVLDSYIKPEGVIAICFSDDGKRLAALCGDSSHTVLLFNWETRFKINEFRCSEFGVFDLLFYGDMVGACGYRMLKFYSITGQESSFVASPHSTMSNPQLWGDSPVTPMSLRSRSGSSLSLGKRHAQLSTIICICVDGSVLYAGLETGELQVWKDYGIANSLPIHDAPIHCVAAFPGGLISASTDGVIQFWSASTLFSTSPIRTAKYRLPSICKGTPLPIVCSLYTRGPSNKTYTDWKVAIGSSAGQCFDIKIEEIMHTTEDNAVLPAVALLNAHGGTGDLWGLATHQHRPILATCGDDCTLRFWDFEKNLMLLCHTLPAKGKSIAFSESGDGHLAVGLSDGLVLVFDSADFTSVKLHKELRSCLDDVFVVSYSPDNRFLAVGSHDDCIHIFDCGSDYRHMGRCQGHTSFITAMDWSTDSEFLQSTSGSNELFYWSMVPTIKQVTNLRDVADIKWSTWTCPIGWPVHGIWKENEDGSEVKTVAKMMSQNVVLVGNENGDLLLYRMEPFVEKNSEYRVFKGHTSMILRVCLSSKEAHPTPFAFTSYAEDMSYIQWKYVPDSE